VNGRNHLQACIRAAQLEADIALVIQQHSGCEPDRAVLAASSFFASLAALDARDARASDLGFQQMLAACSAAPATGEQSS
jgi:hypothetical protein